jgi:tRNA U34 5-methylaminomethyl-2-thiouridine-forming methyltransferase MnmC
MQREIRLTADGSHTIALPDAGITYHSHHGAVGESRHVFIEAGLQPLFRSATVPIAILEVGFGTGLNALLTLQEARQHQHSVLYTAIELLPLSPAEISQLNYGECLQDQPGFLAIHQACWEEAVAIDPYFTVKKIKTSLLTLKGINNFACIYFDAFSPTHQPELWTEAVFQQMYQLLLPGGLLVTYCSKSVVRKAMMAAGFRVEKIPGPWGKREMVRAWRGLAN